MSWIVVSVLASHDRNKQSYRSITGIGQNPDLSHDAILTKFVVSQQINPVTQLPYLR